MNAPHSNMQGAVEQGVREALGDLALQLINLRALNQMLSAENEILRKKLKKLNPEDDLVGN